MRIVTIPRELSEAAVVVIDERRHQRVRRIDGRDPLEPQLLHESILQRQMRPFDASLGRRRVRTDPVDVEFVQGAAELRMAVATSRRLAVDPEDAGLVTVERRAAYRSARDIDESASKYANVDSVPVNNTTISRLVASSTYTSAVHAGARS